MRLEMLFEKFEQFADAPNAVEMLRELVLQLAVQGKLVPQVPHDEPAVNLLNRAILARKEMVSSRIVRDETPDLECLENRDDALPAGWVYVPLAIYTGVIMGQSPPSSAYNQSGKGLPFYQGKAQFGRLYPTATDWCTEPTKIGEPDDVVISVRAPVGPTNMLREKSCIGRGLAALRSLGGNQKYLLYALRALEQAIAAMGVGSTFVAISKNDLDTLYIPVPPLAEQKRIVAKVDELMALCDRLEAQQQERDARHVALARASLARFAEAPTPANLDFLFHKSYPITPADLRKTILTLAVQGDLVHFKTESRIQTVGDHVEFLNGFAFKSEWFKPDGVRLCRNANVGHGVLDWSATVFVDQKVADEFKRFALSEGDVVLSLDRPLITTGLKVARIREKDLPCLLLQRVAKPVPKHDQLDIQYFLLWLNSPAFVDSIDPGRSNGVPHISTRQVKSMPFVLPTLAEQRRIVAKVDQLMALVDQLETELTASRATAEKLMEAMVTELVSGCEHNLHDQEVKRPVNQGVKVVVA